MKKIIYLLFAAGLLLNACQLDEKPVTSVDKDAIFGSQDGLQTYSYSFYNMLPSGIDAHYQEGYMVDYGALNAIGNFIYLNAYSETVSGGWDWGDLRNLNYFIVNCTANDRVDEKIRNNYLGIARFFRAYFYYNKVKQFGDVPWIDKPLDVEDAALYAPKDSREKVMENVYADLQFACHNITATDATGSLVTQWVAYALAARVSLFEGTFRKYHNLSLETSAETWLKRAVENAEYIMKHSGKKLYTAEGVKKSFRAVFTSDDPKTDEVLLAVCSSADLSVYHDANWKWTSATYGSRLNLIRPFINTFLQLDGTPYTNRQGWEAQDLFDECTNRDYRLSQTIRTPGYMREGKKALPDFAGYARLGYQPLKFCVDATDGDSKTMNTNAIPLFRYAEVLLNYAEAKAELKELTDEDWANTIGAIRSRSGITGGLSAKPTQIDAYFQSNYFPSVSDPVLLEIRRERAVELCLEGFRFDDLRRWKCGELLKKSWFGMYITAINEPLDIDHDGTPDVIYYTTEEGLAAAKAHMDWEKYGSTCATVHVSTDRSSSDLQVVPVSSGTGYYLAWDTQNDSKRIWGKKQYLYPIPSLVMVKNPNIKQNTGWEDGATNDGN